RCLRNLLAVEHFKEFLLRTTFVTFVMSVLVTNIGINPTTVEPNFSAWTENQNTIGALRPDRNFATWVHLPRLGSAPLIGFLANIHRKIGRKTLISGKYVANKTLTAF